jgi:hypothetical protein
MVFLTGQWNDSDGSVLKSEHHHRDMVAASVATQPEQTEPQAAEEAAKAVLSTIGDNGSSRQAVAPGVPLMPR